MAHLEVRDVHTYYGESHVLQGVSLAVGPGEVVSLLGRNGAGKTTMIRSIMGLTPPSRGTVTLHGRPIAGLPPHAVCRLGMRIVPQGRHIFPALTVEENLRLALVGLEIARPAEEFEKMYRLFPILSERRRQKGGLLSGGEQQMLAIARALAGTPRMILMDELTEGLAPVVIKDVRRIVAEIAAQKVSILLAEQNLAFALDLATRHYVLEKGRIRFEGSLGQLSLIHI